MGFEDSDTITLVQYGGKSVVITNDRVEKYLEDEATIYEIFVAEKFRVKADDGVGEHGRVFKTVVRDTTTGDKYDTEQPDGSFDFGVLDVPVQEGHTYLLATDVESGR